MDCLWFTAPSELFASEWPVWPLPFLCLTFNNHFGGKGADWLLVYQICNCALWPLTSVFDFSVWHLNHTFCNHTTLFIFQVTSVWVKPRQFIQQMWRQATYAPLGSTALRVHRRQSDARVDISPTSLDRLHALIARQVCYREPVVHSTVL